MSRVGKQLIKIPAGVEVKIDDGKIMVKGPKGQLQLALHHNVHINVADGAVTLTVDNAEDKSQNAIWGTFSSIVQNMIEGVTAGFSKKLEINGVGFKAAVSGKKLVVNAGFSHPVNFEIPQGIEIKVEANVISISGADKQVVGEVAAQIRKIRKPEPYKGKGIKYSDETIRRKAGKAAGAK